MTPSDSDYYEERRRHRQAADEEWAARQPYGPFTVSPELAAWADEVVDDSALTRLPIGPATTAEWGVALGVHDAHRSLYLGHLLDAIAAGAQRDGVLIAPEPGVIAVSYAHRDRETEQEVALGWGFKPAAAHYLVIHADAALDLDQVAGGQANLGAAAVIGVVRLAAASLGSCRQGPADKGRQPLEFTVRPTPWTPLPQ